LPYRELQTIIFEPNSQLTRLEEMTFAGLCHIHSISIPSSVEFLEEGCFRDCTGLVQITFESPSKLVRIGSFAFSGCCLLTVARIPATVVDIGEVAFGRSRGSGSGHDSAGTCDALRTVIFQPDSRLGRLAPRLFYAAIALRTIKIPSFVELVGAECFDLCCSLHSVTFEPDSMLASIGDYAFRRCVSLNHFQFPASVHRLGKQCFALCYTLDSISFESGSDLAVISEDAFQDCRSLQAIYLPSNMRRRGWSTGLGCLMSLVRLADSERHLLDSPFVFPGKDALTHFDDEYWEGSLQCFTDLVAELAQSP
jgi:hypothetical protein